MGSKLTDWEKEILQDIFENMENYNPNAGCNDWKFPESMTLEDRQWMILKQEEYNGNSELLGDYYQGNVQKFLKDHKSLMTFQVTHFIHMRLKEELEEVVCNMEKGNGIVQKAQKELDVSKAREEIEDSIRSLYPSSPEEQTNTVIKQAMEEFVDSVDRPRHSVINEAWREYDFGNGRFVHVPNPIFLIRSESGHRLFYLTEMGEKRSMYVPGNWIAIRWAVRPNQPDFSL